MKKFVDINDNFDVNSLDSDLKIKGVVWASYSKETNLLLSFFKNNNLTSAQQEINKLLLHNKIDFLKELDGSFIMGIKNASNGKSYLYKSLVCKTSLYYKVVGTKLVWSSNVFDLLDEKKSKLQQINPDSLLLTCFGETILPGESHFKNIHRLPAGHILIYENGQITIKKIDYLTANINTKSTIFEFAEQTRYILEQTSKRRIDLNKPIGVLLSGGLDSAVSLCTLKRIGAPVFAYHWSFSGIKAADELGYASRITNHLNVPLYEIDAISSIKSGACLNPNWDFSNPYNHGFYRLFEMTRDLCKEHDIQSLASGYLGDVLFGPISENIGVRSLLKSLPLKQTFKYTRELMGTAWFGKRKNNNTDIHPRMSWYKDYMIDPETMYEKLKYHQTLLSDATIADIVIQCADNETESVLESHLFNKYDMYMYHPFASRELMELSLSIPLAYKMTPTGGQWVDKSVLRIAHLGLLPPEIVSRNHRQLMTAFNEYYVIQNQSQIHSLLIKDSILSKFNIIDTRKLEKVLHDKRRMAEVASGLLCCCMTEIWLRNLSGQYTQKNSMHTVL